MNALTQEITLPTCDALILYGLLEQVRDGKEVSSWGDEARIILDGLRSQLTERIDPLEQEGM